MHSGWLPLERGSTTIFYSLLSDRSPSVTALVLDKNIDAGPIIKRTSYALPDKRLDFDHLYDGLIRSKHLCSILEDLKLKKGSIS